MRGFIVGSLGLIALYVVVTSSDNTAAALTGTQSLISRLLSAQVAGVPNRAAAGAQDDTRAGAPAPAGLHDYATVAPLANATPWAPSTRTA